MLPLNATSRSLLVPSRHTVTESRFLSCKLQCHFCLAHQGVEETVSPGSGIQTGSSRRGPSRTHTLPVSTGWSTSMLGWTHSHFQYPSTLQSSQYRMNLFSFLSALTCNRFLASARLSLCCERKEPHLTVLL